MDHSNVTHPRIDPTADIASTAIIEGDVTIGPGTCILHGAKILSQGAPVVIGRECVIMEDAIVRGAGKHPCTIGDSVLIGPHAHVSGATIGSGVFIATAAVVLNGASLESGTVVQVHATVHINTVCPRETLVPIGYVAFGTPARITIPEELLTQAGDMGFTKSVFGFDSSGWTNARATEELCRRYSRSLRGR